MGGSAPPPCPPPNFGCKCVNIPPGQVGPTANFTANQVWTPGPPEMIVGQGITTPDKCVISAQSTSTQGSSPITLIQWDIEVHGGANSRASFNGPQNIDYDVPLTRGFTKQPGSNSLDITEFPAEVLIILTVQDTNGLCSQKRQAFKIYGTILPPGY